MYVTTAEVIAEENRIADECLFGKGKFEPINKFWEIRDEELNREQREAALHVLNSRDFITGISGNPGVGKTRILQEVKRGAEAGYQKLLALAPWGVTAHDVLRKEGFENAETVAKLLRSEEMQQQARGGIWLVDEAGLLSTREADRLIALARNLDARLVLVGDAGQHHAVDRGQAFDHLMKEGKMEVARVKEIQRQKGDYRRAVELVLEHKTDEAIDLLKEMGNIREMTLEERKVALAKDYVAAIEKRESALVVAPTHAECRDVTEGIRAALKEKGMIKKGVEWDILPNLGWTPAQKSDPDQYRPGLIVQINDHVDGFALGEQLEVIGGSGDMVRVRQFERFTTKIKALPIGMPEAFSVHERDKIEICEGDRIRITGNGRTEDRHRLNTGSLHGVDYISPDGKLVLDNGWRVSPDFKHLQYGYTLTSHASQGKTVDRVFLAQSPELSSGASDLTQFLVSISRGCKGMKLYTTDIELLRDYVAEVRERMMATELLHGESEEKAQEAQKEQGRELSASESLGQSGPGISEEQAEVLAKVPALKQELEVTVPPPVPEREQEEEMGMVMGM
jgi:ATP-dependent exoDNAse (exonuclease V) alpha subunit